VFHTIETQVTNALGLTTSPGKKPAQRLSRADAAHRARKAFEEVELPFELDCKVKIERCARPARLRVPTTAIAAARAVWVGCTYPAVGALVCLRAAVSSGTSYTATPQQRAVPRVSSATPPCRANTSIAELALLAALHVLSQFSPNADCQFHW